MHTLLPHQKFGDCQCRQANQLSTGKSYRDNDKIADYVSRYMINLQSVQGYPIGCYRLKSKVGKFKGANFSQ